jgi:hypothetical protein
MAHPKQYTPNQLYALDLLLDAHPGGASTDDPPQRAVFDSLVARGGIARLEDADTPSGDHYVLFDEYVNAHRAAKEGRGRPGAERRPELTRGKVVQSYAASPSWGDRKYCTQCLTESGTDDGATSGLLSA